MVITKFIMAKGEGELKELIDMFAIFYIASSQETAIEMQKYDRHEDLSDYIDMLERARLACEIDETEVSHVDYIVDLSHLADEASLRMFGYRE
jgi:hypothetical protein